MLNRTLPPEFKTIESIEVLQANSSKLNNGIPVYSVNSGSQEITKIELIFKAGMFYQDQALVASATNNLLEAGTKTYTANQLSDQIDYYGSFFECSVGQDYASIALFSLNRYLSESLHFVEDILKNPIFPQEELDIYLSNKKQKYLVNSQKVNVLARRRFSELLFGEKHPYGIDVKTEDFDKVSRETILAFYKKYYHSGNCTIVVSGSLPPNIQDILNTHFGQEAWGQAGKVEKAMPPLTPTTQRQTIVKKDDAIQSAIRIGRILFNKTHPDYFKFQVLNTILGGYFGSRLMANIREDKGYTYGIGSGLASLVNSGYFYISAEVGAYVTKDALKEIYKEIALLREELVSEEELETVRNYILGQFLRSVDGPFALADKFKAIWEFGLGYDYFDAYFHAVKTITPEEIKALANKYLQEKDLIECVAGNPS
ncbi:MAG: insulinase family protein [Bacteroidetes bacterium]|nr:insulinase family protein [Bacteroidota bacterium]